MLVGSISTSNGNSSDQINTSTTNINNFIQESHEIKVLNSNTYLFINEYYSIVEFDFEQSYLSRAPPIS